MGRRGSRTTSLLNRIRLNIADAFGVQLHAVQQQSRQAFNSNRLTQADLAAELDVATETIRRALGKADADRGAPGPVSFGIAQQLGVRAEYAALALARDEIRRRWTSLRPTHTRLIDRYRAIERELERALESISPYASDRRAALALRAVRLARGVRDKLQYRQLERGEISVDGPELADWVDEIAPGAAAELPPLMERLAAVHGVAQDFAANDGGPPSGHTLERIAEFPPRPDRGEQVWRSRSPAQPALRWYCPPGAGRITVDRSPTVLEGLSVEVLAAHVAGAAACPAPTARSVVRCAGARHPGRELAVVTHGAVLFSASRQPFPDEAPDAIAALPSDCLDHRVFGAGDIVVFDSGLYHRCEFLAAFTRVVSFNIGASICVGGDD